MLIFPIQKAMAEKRRLVAVLDDQVDGMGEALDYAASVPVFKAWSATANALTGGKSWGNVRQQHNLRMAAGLVVSEPVYDDVAKTISFEIEVDDDQAWDRVLKGMYSGISPGGKGRKYTDANGVRRVAMTRMDEISLVDLPCNLNAGVTIVKAAGEEEQVQAVSDDLLDLETAATVTKALAAAAEDGSRAVSALLLPMTAEDIAKAFGHIAPDVSAIQSYAERLSLAQIGDALPDGSWPIQTQADLDAAGDAVLKATGVVTDEVRTHLAQRAVELTLVLPEALRSAGEAAVVKGMSQVAEFAQLIANLRWLAEWTAAEAQGEGDGSQVPARLLAWLRTGSVILADMAAEEAAEAVADLQSYMQTLPQVADMLSDQMAADDIAKALGAARTQSSLLVQVTGRVASLTDELRAANARAAAVEAEVAVLKAQPSGEGPAVFAVTREADGHAGSPAKSDPDVESVMAMPDGLAKAKAAYALQLQGRWKD